MELMPIPVRDSARRTAVRGLVSFLGIALLVSACNRSSASDDSSSPEQKEAPRVAEEVIVVVDTIPGTVVRRPFEESETLRFRLRLDPGLVEIVVHQEGSDVEVVGFDASGRPLVSADQVAGPDGQERIHLVAETPGSYFVEVQYVGDAEVAGTVALEIIGKRQPTEEDRARATADRHFSEAEVLRSRRDRQSCLLAAQRYREALSEFEALGDRARQAEVLQRLGWLYRKYLEERRVALEYYEGARRIFAEIGDEVHESSVLNNLGRACFNLGEMERAVESWKQALSLKRKIGDRSGEASSLGNLGLASRYLGELQEALIYFDQTLDALLAVGTSVEVARAFNNRGRFYHSLGQTDQALADLRRALEIGREIESASLQAMALTAIGRIQLEQGDSAAALESLEAAAVFRDAAGSERGRAVTLRSLGAVYEALERLPEAEKVQHEARALFEEQDAPRSLARAYESLGRLALGRGKPAEAERHYQQARELFRDLGDPEGKVSSLSGMARAQRLKGDLSSALQHMNEALDGVDRLRVRAATPDLRAAFLARHQENIGFLVDLLMEMHRREPGKGYDRYAFEAHERSRARALFDRISAPSRGDEAPRVTVREREAVLELELLSRQHRALRERDSSPRQLWAIESKLDEAVRRLRSIRGEIALHDRQPERSRDRILGVEEIGRELLDRESILLAYRLGKERSYLWMLSAASFGSFELGAGGEIAALVRRAHRLLRSSPLRETRVPTQQVLEQLSTLLLGPVSDSLGSRRLLIIADDALHYLPFAALPAPDGLGGVGGAADPVPLVAAREIVTLPSASSVAALRRRAVGRTWKGSVAVLAAGFPFVAHEAASIRELGDGPSALGSVAFAATAQAVKSPELGAFRVIHLAAHGEIDSTRPELSRLVFQEPGRRKEQHAERVLYADQVASLNLPAELVVLSACETALGREVRGEGFVGLPQGFFQAGASSVLVSLWKVDDRATAELMKRFYMGLLEQGLPAPLALRRAQLGMMRQRGWRAPYFWAGFVLLGDWQASPAKPDVAREGP